MSSLVEEDEIYMGIGMELSSVSERFDSIILSLGGERATILPIPRIVSTSPSDPSVSTLCNEDAEEDIRSIGEGTGVENSNVSCKRCRSRRLKECA